MDQNKPLMLRLLASSVHLAKRAGVEVNRIIKTGSLGVIDKGVQDFQTEADRTAQRLIIASLSKQYPICKIVGEEELEDDNEADQKLFDMSYDEDVLKQTLPDQYKDIKDEDIIIWVDPLDGTTEFVKGCLESVTVLIGISHKGKAVAGVIHQPFPNYASGARDEVGRTIWGLIGMGYYGIEPKQMGQDKLIITSTASHRNQFIEDSINAIKPDELLRVGGAGYKVLLVIEGKAHSYVFTSNGCKKWDTCAPEAILESCGGILTDSFGDHIKYTDTGRINHPNRLGIIASINNDVHNNILGKIPESVKKELLASQIIDRLKH